jgi:hypothetical protein
MFVNRDAIRRIVQRLIVVPNLSGSNFNVNQLSQCRIGVEGSEIARAFSFHFEIGEIHF